MTRGMVEHYQALLAEKNARIAELTAERDRYLAVVGAVSVLFLHWEAAHTEQPFRADLNALESTLNACALAALAALDETS